MKKTKLERAELISGALLFILMPLAIYMAFIYAPTEKTMGDLQRILYFHVPCGIISFVAFFVVAGYSIAFLRTRNRWYDRIALCSAELGVLFGLGNLITGPIWAKPAWNTWWSWDPRLTSMLVLILFYIAYLMLRSFVEDDDKGSRFAAVYAIVGIVDIPIVYFSIWFWRTIHPTPVIFGGGEDSGLHPDMRLALNICFLTFFVLYLFLLFVRMRLEKSNEKLREIEKKIAFSQN